MPFKNLFRSKKSSKRLDKSLTQAENLSSTGNLVRVFKELDCPVCFNTCIPPIHSCINGHIICNTCRQNVQQCPSCRKGYDGTRNFFAENFVRNCSQPCRYAEEGCEYLQLKGDNMKPHESQCMFRPIVCLIPTCGELVPYKTLLIHLTNNHRICSTDYLPASITFHADQPIFNNRKWLPFAIQAFGNVFYVMMEVIRPHFWVWVWLQTTKMEDSYESLFISEIMVRNADKRLKLKWEGPVQSIRTTDKAIMQDGFCFVAHEVFLQHFNYKGYFTFYVNIKKAPRTMVSDLNANTDTERIPEEQGGSSAIRCRPNSDQSLYDSAVLLDQTLRENNENGTNNPIVQEFRDLPGPGNPATDSFASKSSNID